MSRSIINAVAVVGATVLSLSAVGVQAQTEERRVTVPYDRFDLSKPGDVGELYARLQRAARNVCRPLESRDLRLRALHLQCYEDALANAVTDVDNARLSALHESDEGVRIATRAPRART